jgi:hypothetical protein
MNRRGFVGVLAGLLGALGLRGQEHPSNGTILPPSMYPPVDKDGWQGPWEDGYGGCVKVKNDHVKRVPCKEGEEVCPLGHSQKPLYNTSKKTVHCFTLSPCEWKAEDELPINARACSICGVLYVRQKGEK